MSFWLEYYRDKIKLDYDAGYGSGSGVGLKLRAAGTQLQAGNMENAGVQLYEAGTRMYDFTEECITRWSHQRYRLIDWLDECNDLIDEMGEPPLPYELTWRKICEALAKDDFESRYWTIAIIDHMRTLIWNKPFNIIWASKPDKE